VSGKLYASAGVDLSAAEAAKERIANAVARTRTDCSVGRVGAFGGMLRVPPGMQRPVLVLSTDGVGTKVLVARAANRFGSVGEDLVNHSVNDILVHGARPLGFMDYLAGCELSVEQIAELVEGVARACLAHDMALAGGRGRPSGPSRRPRAPCRELRTPGQRLRPAPRSAPRSARTRRDNP